MADRMTTLFEVLSGYLPYMARKIVVSKRRKLKHIYGIPARPIRRRSDSVTAGNYGSIKKSEEYETLTNTRRYIFHRTQARYNCELS
eukprot:scaffold3650_cov76-Cylindrotheca_fusiformis.AAC.3